MPSEIKNLEEQIVGDLRQIADADAAKRLAPHWADLTAQGLSQIAKLRQLGGPPKPDPSKPTGGLTGGLIGAARAAAGEIAVDDKETVAAAEAEVQRACQVPGVMPILEAALMESAGREQGAALGAALGKLRIGAPGAAAK